MVCSITRGPANPINAPGSAIFKSPSIAKLAVTPPVVGSVSTEIYGNFSASNRASAADTFASCIRLIVPSIIRAPPEQDTTISGCLVSIAISIARVTFSPTTAPIEPPINPNSIEQQTTGLPFSCPSAVITASFIPNFFCASLILFAYGLVSTNFSGSVETIPASCSVQRPSSSNSSRCFEFILKWNWHFGHTSRFSSRSFRNTIARQDSHFIHSPSVRTRRSSGGVGWSIGFFSLLNHAIAIQNFPRANSSLLPRPRSAHSQCATFNPILSSQHTSQIRNPLPVLRNPILSHSQPTANPSFRAKRGIPL